jgi:hypothetical protein
VTPANPAIKRKRALFMVTSQGEMKNPAIQKQDLGQRRATHFARRCSKGPAVTLPR